ncbi:OmpA family protein [Dysgonomonas sp. ZJ709]|uniref:OmpA family protein n=1 Tax=Dysgonomonas sp. ZJ709 TaxID=2709797 RepID=UPI0013ED8EC4|nr:OmpA family protein [Dysgonomonas sp. ZJ709]
MKKIILTVAALSLAISGFAQEKGLKKYGFGDNWFIQGQVGGSYTFSEYNRDASLGDVLSPHVALSAGKYFSPEIGARLQVGGWESKNYFAPLDKSYKINYIQTSVDGLLNLTNLFTTYEGDKPFNLIGILGVAYVHGFENTTTYYAARTNSIIPRIGLQGDFRLNDDLSINLEAIGNLMPDRFNGNVEGKNYDGTLNVLAGLTYRFNKKGFETVDVLDPAQIRSLNDQINQQRAQLNEKDKQIAEVKAALAAKPEPVAPIVKQVVGDTEVLMNAVVVFRLGSAKLEQNQDINIYNAAKYLQENPSVNITVTGYADKSTGTAAINQRLSEQRAKAVADILTDKYGIAASRITVEASGDRVQPFQIDAWNRVVIFTAK